MKLSWQQVEKSVKRLAKKIKASKFKPDYLIGITVGGLTPLALLAEELDIRKILIISADSYDGKKQGKLNVSYLPKINLSRKKVLLVDEIAETGRTLKRVSEILLNRYKVGGLKTATIGLNKKKCKFLPDFVVLEENSWIVFPWEKE